MKRDFALGIASVLVFAVAYSYSYITTHFMHANAIGSKQTFAHCQVRNMTGLTNETIEIHQVDHGIKLVEAETFYGAFYGLGFVHAMDRLWQIEFYRRLAKGRLSEVVGSEGILIDQYARTIGVPRMVENQLPHLSPENRLILENYAAGVNKVAENIQMYPSEFYIFWKDFEPFEITDALAMQYLLVTFCTSDWFFELMRERLAEVYTTEMIDKLMPMGKEHLFPFENMETITDEELLRIGMFVPDSKLFDVPKDLLHVPYQLGEAALKKKLDLEVVRKAKKVKQMQLGDYAPNFNGAGSNCWAVHGSKTQSGQPLLACDPHLTKTVQSVWYVTRLSWKKHENSDSAEKISITCASITGTVLLTHGRSKIAAWGVTALNPDVTDLFVEYLRGDTYLSKNKAGWEEVKTKKETIKVRFGEDVEMTLMFTRNGVLLPMNLIDGTASDLMPWIHSDLLQHELVNGRDVHYALAHMYDPMVLSRFEDI